MCYKYLKILTFKVNTTFISILSSDINICTNSKTVPNEFNYFSCNSIHGKHIHILIKSIIINEGGDSMTNVHLIKKRNGVIYHFYLSKAGGICYKLYSLHQNRQIEPFEISITDEKILEFHVTCDVEDNIHMIALTQEGDLKYFVNENDSWNSKTFFHFDLHTNIVKSILMHVIDKKIYILYATSNIMNVNLWTIYFKVWDGFKWATSNIGITICDKDSAVYHAAMDHQNNFHIFYKNSGNKGSQIYYRKYHSQFALWSTPDKIISIPEQILSYYIFCDNRNQLHLVWTTATNQLENHLYKILYQKINPKILNHSKNYGRIVPIDSSTDPYDQPVILEIERQVWMLWKKKNEFFGCEMDISGLSKGSINTIQYSGNTPPILVKYLNTNPMELNNFHATLLYGICEDYVQFILPKSYTSEITDEPSTDLNSTFDFDLPEKHEEVTNEPVAQELAKEISTNLYEELKSENQKLEKMILELKEQINNNEVLSVLNDIKVQNKEFTELIHQMLLENRNKEAQENKKRNGKLINFFRKSS